MLSPTCIVPRSPNCSRACRNANDGIGVFQTIDGGLNIISQIVDRLRTLATQSASATFAGDRSTLNNEYQSQLAEINRQADNIGLSTGGKYNTLISVYIGGANSAANAKVNVDLSGANNGVDTTALGLATSQRRGWRRGPDRQLGAPG